MEIGAITSYVDVAQLVLYAFWIFFAGLIYYLVRENHREGYPMMDHDTKGKITGWPIPKPKTFKLANGEEVTVPKIDPVGQPLQAEPAHAWAGAPLLPTGDPMTAGMGPGAWTVRADHPDVDYEGTNKLAPLRKATDYGVTDGDVDPRGLTVYGGDGEPGGTVVDLWVDISETLFRYLEAQTPSGRRVLIPMNFAKVKRDRLRGDRVDVKAIFGAHFEGVPGLKSADEVTMLEEEKIQAYFGAGLLYADPERAEPLV